MNRDLKSYVEKYSDEGHYEFERHQVFYRRKNILQHMNSNNHSCILEVGCGLDPLFQYIDLKSILSYVVVEPSVEFCNNAKKVASDFAKVKVVNSLIEDANLGEKFDFLIISSLLHEIENPSTILEKIKPLMSSGATAYVNVPNARSFHRLLGYESSLIKDIFEKSDNQLKFQQSHTFDMDSLKNLLSNSGFEVMEYGSYFVKPFTHSQMRALMKEGIVDTRILDGLDSMVKYCPDLGSEIFATFRKFGKNYVE